VVENVKKYIKEHITQKLSLNDIAALYGISPNYLSALFKKYNNCGYSEYITEQKIAKAKRMLTEDNMKVYEVADALGFESAFYFSKVFKKVAGISPSEYLNEH
jgi:two-component system response regulator YesN